MKTITPAVRTRILTKLDTGEALSNVDFDDLGYGFEAFLRYGSISDSHRARADKALRTQLETL